MSQAAEVVEEVAFSSLEGRVMLAEVTEASEDRLVLQLGEGEGEGVLSASDFTRAGQEHGLKVGDRFEVYVEQRANDRDRWLVSKDKADRLATLDRLAQAFEAKQTVEGEVVAEVEGGFAVDVGLKAFLPGSQVAMRPVADADEVLGQRFTFRIIRFERRRQNVVLSRRALLEGEREKVFSALKVGAIVKGVVRSIADYGAFVDIGNSEGLLHVSDMSWQSVKHPSQVVSVGQDLLVKVLKFDRKNKRLSLGLKQVQDDPWVAAPTKYAAGTIVTGMVVSKTDYGCFIQVEPGVEGLVHATGSVATDSAKGKLKKADIGDDLTAKGIDLDLTQKRLSLQLVEG